MPPRYSETLSMGRKKMKDILRVRNWVQKPVILHSWIKCLHWRGKSLSQNRDSKWFGLNKSGDWHDCLNARGIIHFPIHSIIKHWGPTLCLELWKWMSGLLLGWASLSYAHLHTQCTSASVPPSASLTHRPIQFPGVFTLGLSRKAFPGSCEALMKPA